MSSIFNPYQPPQSIPSNATDTRTDEQLEVFFRGTPTESCYGRLWHVSRFDWLLCLLLIAMSPIFVGFILVAVLLIISGPNARGIFTACLLLSLCSVCLWAIFWFLPSKRAKRALRLESDLLSPLQGRLSSDGTSFVVSSDRHYWMHPWAISRARLNRYGLAIPFDLNSARFLPISNLLLGTEDREVIKRIVSSNSRISSQPARLDDWLKLAVSALGLQEDSWVCYGGQQYVVRRLQFGEWVGIVSTILVAAGPTGFLVQSLTHTLVLTILASVAAGVSVGAYFFRHYRRGVSETRYCWGAASSSYWLIGDAYATRVYDPTKFCQIHFGDDHAIVTVTQGQQHVLFRQQVDGGDAKWLELKLLHDRGQLVSG